MSTSITINGGTEAVARRYYGGTERGCCVTVFAENRKVALDAWDRKRIRREGCVSYDDMTFGRWLREQEKAGYAIAYEDTPEETRRNRA